MDFLGTGEVAGVGCVWLKDGPGGFVQDSPSVFREARELPKGSAHSSLYLFSVSPVGAEESEQALDGRTRPVSSQLTECSRRLEAKQKENVIYICLENSFLQF